MPTAHVVLLGDSIFDNSAYTRGEPDVVTHLRGLLGPEWQASLCAVDGATSPRLGAQLACVPAGGTHLVVSIGGNDALQSTGLLSQRFGTGGEAFGALAVRAAAFESAYRRAVDAVIALGRRVFLCTVYNGALDPDVAEAARMGLTPFNDVILRTAADRGLDVLELRAICTEASDYANPIEPSGSGGLKIAQGIARMIRADGAPPARIWR